jgi:hypothetical protein
MDLAGTRDTAGAWRNCQATFLAQVVGPHFETICRDWAKSSGADASGEAPGEVAAGVVADPLRRSQIQVDVAVFAPDDPGRPRRVLSLGEAKWDKVMTLGHLERLRRARDLRLTLGEVSSLGCSGSARVRLVLAPGCSCGRGLSPGRFLLPATTLRPWCIRRVTLAVHNYFGRP